MNSLKIHPSWSDILQKEFDSEYYQNIKKTIVNDINLWETIYPPLDKVLNAFEKTPLDKLKVVILWQDPYHWPYQAHWLSFSVQDWVSQPPSLKNIFKELHDDIGSEIPKNWNLEKWCSEWVLLLNAILTVRAWLPASHAKIGWETFTDNIIKAISENTSWVVFILWWNFARSKKVLIDTKKHFIIEWVHPSPFSAYNWFFGSKPFSKTNEILKKLWKKEINWNLV